MDVNDIVEFENQNASNEDEMEAPFEEGGDAGGNDHLAEADASIAWEQHYMVQLVGMGKKKKCIDVADHRVPKQRRISQTTAAPTNKDKGAMTNKSKNKKSPTAIGTPTSKLMASAFKVASSKDKRLVVLMPQLAKVVQPGTIETASASASTSASASVAARASIPASAQASVVGDEEEPNVKNGGKKLTSWVWEHFTRYEVDVEEADGSLTK